MTVYLADTEILGVQVPFSQKNNPLWRYQLTAMLSDIAEARQGYRDEWGFREVAFDLGFHVSCWKVFTLTSPSAFHNPEDADLSIRYFTNDAIKYSYGAAVEMSKYDSWGRIMHFSACQDSRCSKALKQAVKDYLFDVRYQCLERERGVLVSSYGTTIV